MASPDADATLPSGLPARVAVVGTGVIGASWAALFLAHGMAVAAHDPAPGAADRLRRAVDGYWPVLDALGLHPGANPDRLTVVPTPEAAAEGAGFVQESGPERLDLKRALFARLDEAAPAGAVLATSASTLTVSEFQDACGRHPERVVLGHPFNPPHLVPLVEVGGGAGTAPEAVARATAFYRACGRRPIVLRREIRGHVANRLQAVLWQEAFHLVQAGVASVADVDAAIAHGPGLRWALGGPFLNLHLSGGAEGIAGLFGKPLWAATEALWRDAGHVHVDGPLAAGVVAGVAAELAPHSTDAVQAERDRLLAALLRLKAGAEVLP